MLSVGQVVFLVVYSLTGPQIGIFRFIFRVCWQLMLWVPFLAFADPHPPPVGFLTVFLAWRGTFSAPARVPPFGAAGLTGFSNQIKSNQIAVYPSLTSLVLGWFVFTDSF